ncbi:MAG: hypothetical protein ACXAD7_10750 [Candidatus Kariarchaeaceae archaeon]
MYIHKKQFTRRGHFRFGSTIFVNDIYEELIDSITGQKRQANLLFVASLLILINFFLSNFFGILITALLFYVAYFISIQDVEIAFTHNRLLQSTSYRYPNWVRIIGALLFIFAILPFLQFLNFIQDIHSYNLRIMEDIFQWLGFRNFVYYRYSSFVSNNIDLLGNTDAILMALFYIWFGFQFLVLRYDFQEIHYSHVSEQLVSLGKNIEFIFSTLFILFSISMIALMQNVSILTLVVLLIIYRYLPRKTVANISLIGVSGRILVNTIQILPREFRKCYSTTASIFGWIPQGDYSTRAFPYNLVPREVASLYETGLRASLIPALKQGNLLGLIISSIINIAVIGILFNFALNHNKQSLRTVYFVSLGLIGTSAILWLLLNGINRYRYIFQPEEALMIGNGFVSRYIEPSIWILKGSGLEGTRVQRGVSRRLIRYDKTRGLIIAWRRFTIYLILLFITLLILIWESVGGLNFSTAIYIFPFIFNESLEFLSNKANAELSFFSIIGYIFWILLVINYPRVYAISRPQLFLEMQYPALAPIILKGFEDHQDASVQFTKCLIESSRPNRRKSKGRPGLFKINVYLSKVENDVYLDQFELSFQFGISDRNSQAFIIQSREFVPEDTLIMEQLKVSAETGYPRLLIKIFRQMVNEEKLLVHGSILELKPKKLNVVHLKTLDNLHVYFNIEAKRGVH